MQVAGQLWMFQIRDFDRIGSQGNIFQLAGKSEQAKPGILVFAFVAVHPFVGKTGAEGSVGESGSRGEYADFVQVRADLDLGLGVIGRACIPS